MEWTGKVFLKDTLLTLPCHGAQGSNVTPGLNGFGTFRPASPGLEVAREAVEGVGVHLAPNFGPGMRVGGSGFLRAKHPLNLGLLLCDMWNASKLKHCHYILSHHLALGGGLLELDFTEDPCTALCTAALGQVFKPLEITAQL